MNEAEELARLAAVLRDEDFEQEFGTFADIADDLDTEPELDEDEA